MHQKSHLDIALLSSGTAMQPLSPATLLSRGQAHSPHAFLGLLGSPVLAAPCPHVLARQGHRDMLSY